MKSDTKKSVANSLEVDQSILDLIPKLLQDLWSLGSSHSQILDVIGKLEFQTDNPHILDLGCGKGFLSVNAASKFNLKVTGIDAMSDFLEIAKTKSAEFQVQHLCTFIENDINNYVEKNNIFDAVIYAALGGAMGSIEETIVKLRSQIKENGYILIDDGYLKNSDESSRTGYEHYTNYKSTKEKLEKYGDKIIDEISTTEISNEINYEYLESIKKRYQQLISEYPEAKPKLDDYIKLQEEECHFLEDELEGVLWVIRKSEKH